MTTSAVTVMSDCHNAHKCRLDLSCRHGDQGKPDLLYRVTFLGTQCRVLLISTYGQSVIYGHTWA